MSNTTEPEQTQCLARHGYYCGEGPGGKLYLFVPHGHDGDGNALTAARLASDYESALWLDGPDGWARLAVVLQRRGVPVRMPKRASAWGKALDGLRAMVGLGRGKR